MQRTKPVYIRKQNENMRLRKTVDKKDDAGCWKKRERAGILFARKYGKKFVGKNVFHLDNIYCTVSGEQATELVRVCVYVFVCWLAKMCVRRRFAFKSTFT